MLIKKYGNRRLYDVARSKYVTLADLAEGIRAGDDLRAVDAKTGEDLTTQTLAQIIIEGRGAAKLLPNPLLIQLIRMRDDALAEFLGQYVTWALEVYLQAKQGMQAISPVNPFFSSPFSQMGAGFPRMFGFSPTGREGPAAPPQAPPPQPASASETAALRQELEELKQSLKKRRR